MADTGIFATTAEVQRKVGAGASATSNVEAYINQYMTEAESYINTVSKKNWSDIYSTLNVDVKGILKRAASALAAIAVIRYDSSLYNSTIEWQSLLDALTDEANKAIAELKEKDKVDFIVGA